jgi:ADP-ribose pyrophosphatase YjhB (NUDIX family)
MRYEIRSQREIIVRAIIVQDGKLLVNKSRNKKTGDEYFALPGGHVDPGESCAVALIRELQEELAAEIYIHDMCFVSESIYPGRKKNESQRHELVLYFHSSLTTALLADETPIKSPEADKNFGWLPFEDLSSAPLLPTSVKNFLLAMIADEEGPHYVFTDSTQ